MFVIHQLILDIVDQHHKDLQIMEYSKEEESEVYLQEYWE